MTQGIVFFAYNTEEIDYLRLATIAAGYAKRHMPEFPVCLITSVGDWNWFQKNYTGPQEFVDSVFDEVVLAEPEPIDNKRTHHDSPWHQFVSQFRNSNKHHVYELSPYDQTLLLDIDYIMQNDQLRYVFDSDNSVTLFHEAENLIGESPAQVQQWLHSQGIAMLWSTVVYFDKRDKLTKQFFDLWAHISDNYEFYKFLYGFPGQMFRTDFCVSIAAHILNGMGPGPVIDAFPNPMIYMSQQDDIAKINDINDWVYLVTDRNEQWETSLTKISKENVHVMNKRAIERHYDTLIDLLTRNDI